MMTKQTALTVLLAVVVFASCKKDDSGGSTASLAKSYTEDVTYSGGHSVTTYNISYDGSNRVTGIVSTTNAGDKFVFQYTGSTSFTTDIYSSNVLTIHQVGFINSSSLLDSTFQYNNTKDSSTEKYTYDASKLLTSLKEYDYKKSTGSVLANTHSYTYDANGNMLTDSDKYTKTTYTYTSLPFSSALSTGAAFTYVPKNLPLTTSETSGGTTTTVNHTYTFDSAGRLSTQKTTGGGATVIKTYNY